MNITSAAFLDTTLRSKPTLRFHDHEAIRVARELRARDAFPSPFVVVPPGIANGGVSYGASIVLDGGVEEIYAIRGASKVDAEGWPEFDASWASTLVHEFAHSYVGPLIDNFAKQLLPSGDRIFLAVAAEMRQQAYGTGKAQ